MKSMIIIILLSVILQLSADDLFSDYEDYKKDHNTSLSGFKFQQDSLFVNYRLDLERLWLEFVESTPYEWVRYGDHFLSRSRVDFQQGTVELETIIDRNEKDPQEKVRANLEKQLEDLLQAEDNEDVPILEDQIADPEDYTRPIDSSQIEETVSKILNEARSENLRGKDGVERIKYKVSLELVPEHIRIRADKYRHLVQLYCERFRIDPALVLAVIHTESYFNPRAYNRRGNAYGLMQIVPRYAGLVMNRELYDLDRKPSPGELYDPVRNLEMGIGYLRWLTDNIWPEIVNGKNLEICLICSYNGGPGSVYKAIAGKMKGLTQDDRDRMIKTINEMAETELINHLHRTLPYKETADYLRNVWERMNSIYRKT